MKTTFFTPLVARLTIAASLFCLADGHAATLVNNVKGYTLDEAGKRISFTNMVIEEGKVLALDVQPDNHHIDEVIDGEGKVMLPGLIDAHGHLLGLGANLLEVNLRDSKSAKHAASMVADYAFANTTQDWITGRGWNQELWSDRAFPRAQDLDNVVSDRPVFLTRVDGHAAWVNSKAMALAGITKDTPPLWVVKFLKTQTAIPLVCLLIMQQH